MSSTGAQPKKTTKTLRPKWLEQSRGRGRIFYEAVPLLERLHLYHVLESRNYSLADLKLRLELSASHEYRDQTHGQTIRNHGR